MTEKGYISLPRPLVNRLLHVAQLHPSQTCWGIISTRNGQPERCHLLEGESPSENQIIQAQLELLAQNQERLWAVFRSGPSEPGAPTAAELSRIGTELFLSISLETKGVLQLKSWRITDGRLLELEVTIHETAT